MTASENLTVSKDWKTHPNIGMELEGGNEQDVFVSDLNARTSTIIGGMDALCRVASEGSNEEYWLQTMPNVI